MKNGVDVRLPEFEIDRALDQLVALDRDKKIFSRDITLVDLRLPDRVTVRLSDAAFVNAIATATEAKAQALFELGVAGTGTATDAVCIATPADGRAETFGGPRSRWGSRLARAVRDAVRLGAPA